MILVTQTSDYRDPSSAAVIQHRLNIPDDCITFDINLGCSGFVCGLGVAGRLLSGCSQQYVLLLCGETGAREKDPSNPKRKGNSDTMLFGDAGTAILLEKDERSTVTDIFVKNDGNRYNSIIVPYGGYRNPSYPDEIGADTLMDEIGVFNFSTNEVPEMINMYMSEHSCTSEDYDFLVLHQANKYIMDRIAKKTGFDFEKSLVSIDHFGNTSSASIPITLVHNFGNTTETKELSLLCCGYGIGLSWAVAELKVNTEDILPVIQTNDYFDDGYRHYKCCR